MHSEEQNVELNPKSLVGTIMHDCWGCMEASRRENVIFIDSIMNHDLYLKILKDNLMVLSLKFGY